MTHFDNEAVVYLMNNYGRSLVKLRTSNYTEKQKVEAEYKIRTGIDKMLHKWKPTTEH